MEITTHITNLSDFPQENGRKWRKKENENKRRKTDGNQHQLLENHNSNVSMFSDAAFFTQPTAAQREKAARTGITRVIKEQHINKTKIKKMMKNLVQEE